MDTNQLKRFAQEARKLLLSTVANKLKSVLAVNSPARRETAAVVAKLEKEIRERTEAGVVDFVAYTWFNRFCALRYMDVMGYNPVRVVSPLPGHTQPEILEEAKGEYIAFLDSDDGFEPQALETLWCLREQAGTDTAACAHLNLRPDGSSWPEQVLGAGASSSSWEAMERR